MAEAWAIRNWVKTFETSDSKRYKSVSWISVPNKLNGRGLRRLLAMENGMELFGAWVLIAEVASTMPVRGILADEDGPLSGEDIADKIGCRKELIEHALQILSSDRIGWIHKVSCESLGDHSKTASTERNVTRRNGTERKASERKASEILGHPATEAPPPLAAEAEPDEVEPAADSDLATMQRFLHATAQHLTKRPWNPPDKRIAVRALQACRGAPLESVCGFLDQTIRDKVPRGSEHGVEVRNYAYVVKLLEDQYGGTTR